LDELATLLASDGMSFLRRRATPALLASAYRWEAVVRRNPHVRQLVAFSFARAEKHATALRLLNRIRHIKPDETGWQRAIAAQSEMLYDALRRGTEEANNLLLQWEANTRQALKLP
jgi:hypothetical protein